MLSSLPCSLLGQNNNKRNTSCGDSRAAKRFLSGACFQSDWHHHWILHLFSFVDTFAAITLELKPNALLKHLKPIAAKYHALGVQLGLTPAKIREFETEAYGQGAKLYLEQVLHRWLDGDPQLDLLVEALIEIDNRRLAEKLKKDYAGRFLI